uniref:PAS domain-containing protein n=1 Tax=Chaetoceros debilis TaxID=122233 RepID=A0A7S3VD20_9STRA|eukprot:CAMPEP_0194087178 /NCGR_PEP_ID=MMETSP0149-20130528/23928_1 /TAXON_ID=122233 /ORGANISM="Chaetoceros debilis, Strain MM31A-1" /LENGTH=503 /DNA_ID=CAMNT_0038770451 /DNA_START=131 /DNA_END=1642 /DNA_ORIENTATION=-
MKGNQGLEALATLCNNASKSNEDQETPIAPNEVRSNHQSTLNNNATMQAPAPVSAYNAPAPSAAHNFNSMNGSNLHTQNGQQQAVTSLLSGGSTNDASNALQQMAYLQLMQQQQQQQQPIAQLISQAAAQVPYPFAGFDQNTVNSLLLAAQQRPPQPQVSTGNFNVPPTANSNVRLAENGDLNSMQTPQFVATQTHSNANANVSHNNAAPQPHQPILSRSLNNADSLTNSNANTDFANALGHGHGADETRARSDSFQDAMSGTGDKKSLKRAANRRSAQLSRKRKKQFIEELKEENDELRRKEQILRSIPDLIVVFDSSGKLGFVSHSVSNFLQFTPNELVGTSFWERLCENSVRLLKAAFMDALAARSSDHETTPLGAGVWELRLQDKNGNYVLVTLNGVVHFSGDCPECVCSVRPMQDCSKKQPPVTGKTTGTKNEDTMHVAIDSGQSPMGHKGVSNPNLQPAPRNNKLAGAAPAVAQAIANGLPVSISDVESGTSVVSGE